MLLLDAIARRFPAPRLTRQRIAFALAAAAATDALQIALGPLGWVGTVQVLDVVACAVTCILLGFHVLLLPTFVLELFPVVDMLPTWTGCVAVVVALRRKTEREETMRIPASVTSPVPPVNPAPNAPQPPLPPPASGPGPA